MAATSFLKWLWGSLFGTTEEAHLVLRPTPTAQTRVAGFQSGSDLTVRAHVRGETVLDVLERLNVYRGPDQQLVRVWNPETGQEFPGTTVLEGTMVVEVRPESI